MAPDDFAANAKTPSPRTFNTPSRLGKRNRASPADSPSAHLYGSFKSATRRSASAYRQSPLAPDHFQESPSARLLLELSQQDLEYNRQLSTRLDNELSVKADDHNSALAAAAAEHDKVRLEAERAQRRAELRHERERLELEEEEQQELYRQQQETVEREIAVKRRELEEQRLLEERRRAAAEIQAQAEAEKRASLHRAKEEQEIARKAAAERDEFERQAIRAADAARQEATLKQNVAVSTQPKAATASASTSQPSAPQSTAVSGLTTDMAHRELVHQKYIELHKRLKQLRKFVTDQSKANPQIKKRIGEMRREIRKSVGQLTSEKGANRTPMITIKNILLEASKITVPSVDVRPYILEIPPSIDAAEPSQVSALMLYQMNILAKAVVSQFIDEASVAPKAADPAGVLAISIFAAPDFRWKGISLIDMLLAKYHVVCPVLFGIYGSEKTEGGRKRLGWRREDGHWIGEQKHGERMTGLGAGYAAVSLRDFKNSQNPNPYPPSNYWQAVARITNTPKQDITETHYLVLKAMIENHADKFAAFFGQRPGMAALRRAIVDFTQLAPQGSVAAGSLKTLRTTLQKDLRITL